MSPRGKAKARVAAIAAFFLLIAGTWAGAQESGSIDTNVDSLFGGDEVVSEAPAQNPADAAKQNPVTAALKSDKVRVGGSFYGSITPTALWKNFWDGDLALSDDTTSLGTSLKSTLFFDARPTEDFRVYGSAKAAYPFSATIGGVSVPNLSVFELFADFNLNDKVYFRMGKSTVKWGVGYFWSPADVINLEPINVLDAEAQREGPINFRVNIPVAGTQDNLYFYTILDSGNIDFDTTALAAKAEFLLGNYEVGLGAYYRYDTAERAMLTLTGPLGDFDVFGEAMASRGSAKTFVTSIDTGSPFKVHTASAADNRENFYFSASAGFLYSNQNENFTAVGQYYYNGEGYSLEERDALISQAKLAMAFAYPDVAKITSLTSSLSGLVSGSGQHYAALMLSKGKLFALEDLSASVIAVANLSDWSGLVKPSISWSVVNNFKLTLSPMFFFGPEGSGEFSMAGDAVYLSLGAVVSASF
ncbi:hypothetical protein LWX53_06790 [bacterium]|nr:hypothetical protein [bacterium]